MRLCLILCLFVHALCVFVCMFCTFIRVYLCAYWCACVRACAWVSHVYEGCLYLPVLKPHIDTRTLMWSVCVFVEACCEFFFNRLIDYVSANNMHVSLQLEFLKNCNTEIALLCGDYNAFHGIDKCEGVVLLNICYANTATSLAPMDNACHGSLPTSSWADNALFQLSVNIYKYLMRGYFCLPLVCLM